MDLQGNEIKNSLNCLNKALESFDTTILLVFLVLKLVQNCIFASGQVGLENFQVRVCFKLFNVFLVEMVEKFVDKFRFRSFRAQGENFP